MVVRTEPEDSGTAKACCQAPSTPFAPRQRFACEFARQLGCTAACVFRRARHAGRLRVGHRAGDDQVGATRTALVRVFHDKGHHGAGELRCRAGQADRRITLNAAFERVHHHPIGLEFLSALRLCVDPDPGIGMVWFFPQREYTDPAAGPKARMPHGQGWQPRRARAEALVPSRAAQERREPRRAGQRVLSQARSASPATRQTYKQWRFGRSTQTPR